jgi:hypothetical protein
LKANAGSSGSHHESRFSQLQGGRSLDERLGAFGVPGNEDVDMQRAIERSVKDQVEEERKEKDKERTKGRKSG